MNRAKEILKTLDKLEENFQKLEEKISRRSSHLKRGTKKHPTTM